MHQKTLPPIINSQVKRKAASLGISTILEKPLSFNTPETAIQEVCGTSDAPMAPELQDQIVKRTQSHMEFFSGESLLGMPPCEVDIRAPKTGILQAADHYVLMSPIAGKRDAKGLLFIVLEGQLEHPPVQLNYLTICAHHLSTLLEGIEHFAEFTIRDPLTGLFTNAYLEEQIQHLWTLAKCQQFPIGLLSLDINEFSAINDQFGFATGDRLLQKSLP